MKEERSLLCEKTVTLYYSDLATAKGMRREINPGNVPAEKRHPHWSLQSGNFHCGAVTGTGVLPWEH